MSADRPLLALDVDGVISVFGFGGGAFDAPGPFHSVDGILHCIPPDVGPRVQRLIEVYDVVWATGWEDRANDYLISILELDTELPVIRFEPGAARFGTAHWKLGPISEHAGNRPVAWVDDNLDEECRAWAEARAAPTLLVATESSRGLTEAQVERLIAWASAGYTEPG